MTIQRFRYRVGTADHLDLEISVGIQQKALAILALEGLGGIPSTVAIGINKIDAEVAIVVGVGVPITWIEKTITIRIDIGR